MNAKGINLHYKNTTFHRVVHGLLVQGGDIMSKCVALRFLANAWWRGTDASHTQALTALL